jgi:ribonuclease I
MKHFIFLSLITLILSNNLFQFLEDDDPYDSYSMCLEWLNNKCFVKDNKCNVDKFKRIEKNILTIHGLWPQYKSGKYMYSCGDGKRVKLFVRDNILKEQMNKYWVSENMPNENFWEHEYNKHGLCYTEEYGLRQEDYYKRNIELFQKYKMNTLLKDALGHVKGPEVQIEYDKLMTLLKRVNSNINYNIRCTNEEGKQYFDSLRIFFDLDFKPIDSGRGNCYYKKPVYIRIAE